MLAKTLIFISLSILILYAALFSALSFHYERRISESVGQQCRVSFSIQTVCKAKGSVSLVYFNLKAPVQGYFRKGSYSFRFSDRGSDMEFEQVQFLPNTNNWLLFLRRHLLPIVGGSREENDEQQ